MAVDLIVFPLVKSTCAKLSFSFCSDGGNADEWLFMWLVPIAFIKNLPIRAISSQSSIDINRPGARLPQPWGNQQNKSSLCSLSDCAHSQKTNNALIAVPRCASVLCPPNCKCCHITYAHVLFSSFYNTSVFIIFYLFYFLAESNMVKHSIWHLSVFELQWCPSIFGYPYIFCAVCAFPKLKHISNRKKLKCYGDLGLNCCSFFCNQLNKFGFVDLDATSYYETRRQCKGTKLVLFFDLMC